MTSFIGLKYAPGVPGRDVQGFKGEGSHAGINSQFSSSSTLLDDKHPSPGSSRTRLLVFSAWASILLLSDLPEIAWKTLFGQIPGRLLWAKLGVLVVFLGLCLAWRRIRPLWPYAFVMLVFYAALGVSWWAGDTGWWQGRFGGQHVSFTLGYIGIFIRDAGVAVAVIAALWVVKRSRSAFFLVKGRLDAPIEPVSWLGIRGGESWRTFGWIFTLIAGFAVMVPLALSTRPTADTLMRAAPLIPAVLLFSAVNAFTEEVYFRASLLSTLPDVVGKNHALLINAVFFGLNHWTHGSPPGVVGFLMTGFLAWILGKSMLETKGLFWPWLIHFVPDVVIFASYAVLWVRL